MNASNLSPLKQAFLRIEELEARLEQRTLLAHEPIAVVGIGCRLPGAADGPDAFWELLRSGADATREVPADRWDVDRYYDSDREAPGKTYSRRGGFLDKVDGFDAPFFKISPREAVAMDPQQRLLLEVAWEAFENAGVPPRSLENSKSGVFIALSTNDYWNLQVRQTDLEQVTAYHGSGIAYSVASGRLSYVFGLQGPSISIDTACSGSLVAVHLACQSLRAGECQMAIAGGVNLILSPDNSVIFAKSKMLAADGRCKTFDAAADGFGEGEGCGLVVLKPLSSALADGSTILAVIRGSAVNQDGPSSGLTAPNGPSQEAVIRDAMAMAGIKPSEIGYVEAHGTGTTLGDPIEVQALAAALGEGRSNESPLWIGSVKSNLGHLEAAAGISGLIKTILALRNRIIPPNLHLHTPNPFIPWANIPVAVPTTAIDWPATSGRRLAGVSAFGFSGTNAHVILEEAPAPFVELVEVFDRPTHILALSGSGAQALKDLATRHAAFLLDHPDANLADICWSANSGRSAESYRLAIVAADNAEMARALTTFSVDGRAEASAQGTVEPGDAPKIAFLLTGQGSQYAGMGRALYDSQPIYRAALDRCSEILVPLLDRPLLSILFGADDSAGLLNQTMYTQPALFSLEYALSEMWQSWGVRPAALLGHSVGEYVAAVISGVWSLEDGLRLITARSRLMQELPPGGEMAAIFADEAKVATVLRERAGVSIAAINGPKNVVISGDAACVRSAVAEFASAGIESQSLTVSHAFHSPLMEPMLERFGAAARSITANAARIPIASNVSGTMIQGSGLFDSHYLQRHVREPVRFADGLHALRNAGITVFLEVGPSPTLVGMGRRVLGSEGMLWRSSLARGRDDWQAILGSLGSLYVNGVEIDWKGFDRPYGRTRVAIPTYPFQRQRYWFEKRAESKSSDKRATSTSPRGKHPLVQRRVPSALGIFESEISTSTAPWIGDHRVRGRIVLPATAYLEAARAAAASVLGHEQLSLQDIVIGEAFVLPEGESRTLQIVVTPGRSGEASFQIFSADAEESDSWRLHASGRAAREVSAPFAFDAGTRAVCVIPCSVEDHYRELEQRSIELGPAFHGIAELRSGEREALGELRLSREVYPADFEDGIHPVLLDAAFQVMSAALPSDESNRETYLPMSFDRVDFHASLSGVGWTSHVQVRPSTQPNQETITADVRLYDDAGQLVVNVSGLHLKRMPASVLASDNTDDWMYEVRWQEQTLEAANHVRLSPGELGEAMSAALPPLQDRSTRARYDELVPQLDAIGGAWVALAFRALGCRPSVGEVLKPATLSKKLGVLERHDRLFGRMLEILGEDGFLEKQGSEWLVTRELEAHDPLAELQTLLVQYPEYEAEISMLGRCGPHLAGVLRGQTDPLELLFPGGDTSTAERLYEQSPLARAYNGLVRSAVLAAADKMKTGRAVRILEIGGGTGGTTSGLLPELSADHTEYVFTDISKLFTAKASQKYRQYPFVQYRELDIERPPREQGFDGTRFDIVVAANVLHATRDLRETMTHVRDLLSPDGVLVALEMVLVQRDIDLVFGLTDGWWRFTDTDRRLSSLLMTSSKWLTLLRELHFREAFAVPDKLDCNSRALNQAVLVAGGAASEQGEATKRDSPWLVFESDAKVSAELIRVLSVSGEKAIRVRRGTEFASLGDGRFTVNPTNVDDYKRLRESAFPDSRRCAGIIHLWSVDAGATTDAAILESEQALGARSVLNLVQTFSNTLQNPARLSLVTRGAQAFANEKNLRVSQSPVWGLAKVIALEHPDLRCLRIDLDPNRDMNDVSGLAAELRANSAEDQVLFRDQKRYVARLERSEKTQFSARPAQPVRFEVGTRGLLDSVAAKPMLRKAPGAGEVEIRVAATGLNMRDVLGAMGLYPGDPGPLGSECAGTITAVGPDVHDLHVGDEVLAIVPGCLSTFVTGLAHFVVRRPARLTMEQSASVAIPYVTAQFALHHIARLQRGERVLIHAAAGGVGLAAIQLARRAGAEIVATAGNAEKRAYLRSLGIEAVLDSRSTEFAKSIREQLGDRSIDVALNSLGHEFVAPGLSVLAPGGRFIEIAKTGILTPEQISALPKDIHYHVVDWSEQARETPEVIRGMLVGVVQRLAAGEIEALPLHVFPAKEAIAALRFMGNARHIGKIVLTQDRATRDELPLARTNATYLITGGLRGLGLLVAQRFADLGARNLILMGRSDPTAAALDVISELNERGVNVVVARGDVSKQSDVAREIARAAETLPPIAGVIHSAGVLNDGILQRLDWSRFSEVMAPKVQGTWNLYWALRSQPLDFFICFSSIAALFGSPGQGNHAAANAFEDTFAHFLQSSGIPGQSINWGAWSEVGAAADRNVGDRVGNRGVDTIVPRLGLDALEKAMRSGIANVAISPMRWDKFLEPFASGAEPPFFSHIARPARRSQAREVEIATKSKTSLRVRLAHVPAAKRRSLLAAYVSEEVARVLGVRSAETINQRQPLTDMGLDSLMAVELRNLIRIGLELEHGLPATIVYDYPSVQEMAAYLEPQIPSERQETAEPDPSRPAEASANVGTLDDIEQLTDEEVDRLFAVRVESLGKPEEKP